MHPAQVPLVVKTEPADLGGPGDQGPGGGILGRHDHVGKVGVNLVVDSAEQGDRFEVFAPAELVG